MTISTTVNNTVTVGSDAYPSPLTISKYGAVEPLNQGATGVISYLSGNVLMNYGIVDGAGGEALVHGGVGLDLSAGTVTNNQGAQINGGTSYIKGGSGYYYGGNGVLLDGGTLTNYGTIAGGSVANVFSALAGAGVDLTAGTLTNYGSISAGANTYFGAFGLILAGGTATNHGSITGDGGQHNYGGGVYLNGGALTTSGYISGGASGGVSGYGGNAVQFGSVASTMTVDAGAVFKGAIGGFAPGDTIDITNLTPTQVASYFSPGSYTLITPDDGTLQFAGRFLGEYFTFNPDPSGTGADITLATGSGISTPLTSTVTLGSAAHPSPLTITDTGGVSPFADGATGVLSNHRGNALTNHGAIQGGTGSYGGSGGAGGLGVNFMLTGTLTNTGSITGGTGGTGSSGAGGAGGAGVNLNGGTLTNSGSITGGSGGAGSSASGGAGGAGVNLNGGTLTTSGTISGGQGGSGSGNGAAGDAVQFGAKASTLSVNPGAVFSGPVAANPSVNDVLKLSGTQNGGTPITLGTQFTNFSTLTFASGAAWTVDASTGAASSNPGLAINGFTLSDTIDITNLTPSQVAADFNSTTHVITTASDGTLHFSGISGDYFVFSSDGSTGTDITLATGPINATLLYTVTQGNAAFPSSLTITTTGVVAPAVAGAIGVISNHSGDALTNNGGIHGGAGSNGTTGGLGGVGVNFIAGATLTNGGTINGGTGGTGSSGAGGAGGAGVKLSAGTLTNSGSISGGAGGAGATTGGVGGAGVFLSGGTLITSGSVSGGQHGAGTPNGAAGDAVQFGTAASTLIVDPGAIFNGKVVANASVHDVLELSGTQAGGTAITLGTEFTNFATLDFATGAAWTADATVKDLTSQTLSLNGFGVNDTLDITNLLPKGATATFNASNQLTISNSTTSIQLQFDNNFSGDHFVLAADGSGGTNVTLQPGAASTLAALAHDPRNFVNPEHRALSGERFTLSAHNLNSGSMLHADPVLMASMGHSFPQERFTDHGVAHASDMLR